MSDRFFHITPPAFYREALPGESEDAFTTRLAAELETLIRGQGRRRWPPSSPSR